MACGSINLQAAELGPRTTSQGCRRGPWYSQMVETSFRLIEVRSLNLLDLFCTSLFYFSSSFLLTLVFPFFHNYFLLILLLFFPSSSVSFFFFFLPSFFAFHYSFVPFFSFFSLSFFFLFINFFRRVIILLYPLLSFLLNTQTFTYASYRSYIHSSSRIAMKRMLINLVPCFSPVLVHTQPFLSLVLACLKGQEDQREGLLLSISRQIAHLLNAPPEERCPADVKSKEALQEALHLRISLVGAMFDTIQRSVTLSSDWATLLFQLVSSGTITAESLPSKK